MSFAEEFLKSLTDLFLGLHWIAAFYAVVEPMILIYGFLIYYAIGFLLIPLFFVPVGPLSLDIFDLYGLMAPLYFATEAHPLLVLGAIVGVVLLKFFTYLAVRKNRVLGAPAAWILSAYTAAVLLIMVSVFSLYSWLTQVGIPRMLLGILLYTVPMDLVVFSYVKFRDAASGTESEKWIPALVALWTAIPSFTFVTIIELHWLPETFWRSAFAVILTFMRIAIAAVQSLYVALYAYIRGRGVALEAGKGVYAAQTTTVPGGQHG